MKFFLLLILGLNLSYASEEALRLANLRSKNLKKILLRYEYLLTVHQNIELFCEANLIGRPLLEKTLSDDQSLIHELLKGGDFEKEYAMIISENMASDFFTHFKYEDACNNNGPFNFLDRDLSRSIQNTEFVLLTHGLWLRSYQDQLDQ